jgi:nicotinate-nucleotide--dimethylbenzimidazole phosphoribosyltransferase
MTWERPVPLVGDTSTARQRRDEPRAWALDEEERDAFYATLHGRRDIRRFRPDPIPIDVMERVLGAAHAAPSVGHSQPWRFIVVRDPATRELATVLADREWHRQASQLAQRPGRQMLDLQLHGLREAPVGVVVCCDRRTPPEGVLGRATFVDADLWSCACSIENLWLAARAEGVGVGWVTLFRPEELASLVGLPSGVETLGWLCLGWPDERPPEPGLERSGWSVRQPLDEVVLWEKWNDGAPSPLSHLPDSSVRAPTPDAVVGARDEADVLLTPPGSLGVLDRAVDRLVALGLDAPPVREAIPGSLLLPARPPVRFPAQPLVPSVARTTAEVLCPVTLVIAAAGHPVTRHGVTTYADSVTRDVLEATVAGESLGAVTASMVGATTVAIDAGVPGDAVSGALSCRPRGLRGDLVEVDAMELDDVNRLLDEGRDLARRLGPGPVPSPGIVALGEVGIGNTTVAAALVASELHLPAADVVGLGAGGDSRTLDRKRKVVESAVARAHRKYPVLRHSADADPQHAVLALAALGGPEIAVLSGVVLGAVEVGSLVVIDGLVTATAAMTAVAIQPAVAAHLVAGQQSREQAHGLVNTHLGLEPILSLRLRAGEGVGALLATQLLATAAAVRAGTARTREC